MAQGAVFIGHEADLAGAARPWLRGHMPEGRGAAV